MARLPLLLVFCGVVCATPIARGYEVYPPDSGTGQEESFVRRVPDVTIPQGYDYSRPPSILDVQSTQTSCVQTTYGYQCSSL
jgi:hypothetical protein